MLLNNSRRIMRRLLNPRVVFVSVPLLSCIVLIMWLLTPPKLSTKTVLPFREPPWTFITPADGPDLPRYSQRYSKTVDFVHQTWSSTALPSALMKLRRTWLRCFPNAKHILWTDADNYRLVRRHYPWFAQRYLDLPAEIYRSDAARYLMLFHYGGIYADLDTECIRPFSHILRNRTIVLGAMATEDSDKDALGGLVQNSFMYSKPRHPFWMEMVHYILARPVSDRKLSPEVVTGPQALMFALRDFRRRFQPPNNDISVLPPKYFNPFSWVSPPAACKDRGRMTEDEMKLCRNSFMNESYVIQYHFHTWTLPPDLADV